MGESGGLIGFVVGGLVLIALGLLTALLSRRTARAERLGDEHLKGQLQRDGDGPWVWELETDQLRFTSAIAPLLENVPSPCSTETWFARVHKDDLAPLRAAIDEVLSNRSERLDFIHRIRHADGAFRWVSVRARRSSEKGRPDGLLLGCFTVHNLQTEQADASRNPAFRDPLTGLPNVTLFLDRLSHAISRAGRTKTRRFAVMYVDLADFRAVNQRLGRAFADDLLVSVATRLESSIRPGDTVARVGSDEFGILLEGADESSDALAAAERIRRALLAPLPKGDDEDMSKSPSIGIVLNDGALLEAREVLQRARDAALESRNETQGRPVLFDPNMHDKAVERSAMEHALRTAVERGQLSVHYQPMVDLTTGAITGFEALARWRHPTLGLISPLSFIPLAEETGLISELGAWILFESLAQVRKWQDASPDQANLSISVNLSTRQLRDDPDLVQRVAQALHRTGVSSSSLILEVNESLLLEGQEQGARLLAELHERGVRVCMDDFGTGYSSLSYLHRARVDILKIDLSFVRHLTEDSEHAEIVRTILTLAKSLGLPAIAEGVETDAQLTRLRALGCAGAQGYLFSAPVDAESASALLRTAPRW